MKDMGARTTYPDTVWTKTDEVMKVLRARTT